MLSGFPMSCCFGPVSAFSFPGILYYITYEGNIEEKFLCRNCFPYSTVCVGTGTGCVVPLPFPVSLLFIFWRARAGLVLLKCRYRYRLVSPPYRYCFPTVTFFTGVMGREEFFCTGPDRSFYRYRYLLCRNRCFFTFPYRYRLGPPIPVPVAL